MTDINHSLLVSIALDLATSLANEDRFDRLLTALRKAIPCDAIALLAYRESQAVPLAIQGLSTDTRGRRFHLDDHPRFKAIADAGRPVRFATDSDLPDPYDGLLLAEAGDLPVHACMGLPLYSDNRLLGFLTLDSLQPDSFDSIGERTLEVVSALAAATLKAAMVLDGLEQQAQRSVQVMQELTSEALSRDGSSLLGGSAVMTRLKQELALVAPSDFTVLVLGETGVGKELVARTLHAQSNRRQAPLVHINCAALPEQLIESELFGHTKGAFTGAANARTGKFLLADGGTLFLDEVGELSLATQSKLLRTLQNGEIQPVGQDRVQLVDVRVIAATNRNLKAEVAAGRFRADLYHRLSVYPIKVPPLRSRGADILLLAGFFLENTRRRLGLKQLKLGQATQSLLLAYDWPGNVRELEHCISRSALKAVRDQGQQGFVTINPGHCDLDSTPAPQPNRPELPADDHPLSLKAAVDAFQRKLISDVLAREEHNWSATARHLEMDRANLQRLAKRLGIRVKKDLA
ncbi:nitric oxide reductase transcriptional regulator NorR [Marinobacterium rhizophilum]|uniref:nitric oxide reductase transcriptional regulator NorR n=1 Tax=Marinobacterium rhizophilum TaxID=420402 RepID=UPI00036D9B9D|nr:nitric oxide reductase transcriptional regulator NorR [Marinobacterium rhizophilum]